MVAVAVVVSAMFVELAGPVASSGTACVGFGVVVSSSQTCSCPWRLIRASEFSPARRAICKVTCADPEKLIWFRCEIGDVILIKMIMHLFCTCQHFDLEPQVYSGYLDYSLVPIITPMNVSRSQELATALAQTKTKT